MFIRELAAHLDVGVKTLSGMAQRRRLLKRSRIWRMGSKEIDWVTPFGAAQLIAWVRMSQGAETLDTGKDWFVEHQKLMRTWAKSRLSSAKRAATAAKPAPVERPDGER